MDILLKNKAFALIITVVIAGVAWYVLLPSSEQVLSSDTPISVGPLGTAELVEGLLTLRAVSLDGSIFSSPSFQVLQDFTTPIVAEPVGRPNPFAPLGVDVAGTATSTQITNTRIPAPVR